MGDEDKDVRLWLTRLETKLDVVLDQHGSTLNDHEGRIRAAETEVARIPALEQDLKEEAEARKAADDRASAFARWSVGTVLTLLALLATITIAIL